MNPFADHAAVPPPIVDRAQTWLKDPNRVGRVWLGTPCVIAAWLGIFLAIVSSPEGVGVSLCWVHGTTGIPCIGCGLTRSLGCALRGLFAQSWALHPFGIALLAMFLTTAGQSLLPERLRGRIRNRMEAHPAFWNGFYLAFVALFVVHGTLRALTAGFDSWR